MGARVSLEDELINLKMTSKQMISASKKSEKKHKENLAKVKKAIQQGNKEGAQIYAQNAIREKTQALNYLRLSSRLDAVAARLETAIRTQQINKAMVGVVQGMGSALKSMDVEKISATMTNFEQQFEDMDVRAGYMEGAMNSSTSSATPQEDVDSLIKIVADENQLELGAAFEDAAVPTAKPAEAEQTEAAPQDDLAARLAALRG
uniref:Uncharacterized protein n=1 Tax=Rhizochromulina marina TaxID=1034831 RepID=A0A7S2WTG4_9STRA|mmetsp:Transcript_4177/g.12343  ORF Transcript_4177/g.12343 Transcript_4177/m.12343 type:complete len:205 (+) Transcript_4177:33-647(+)